jgi:hypothetical protein
MTRDARLSALHRGFALSKLLPAHSASKTRVNALLPGIQELGPRFRGDERKETLLPKHPPAPLISIWRPPAAPRL